MPPRRLESVLRTIAAWLENSLFGSDGLNVSGQMHQSPSSWPLGLVLAVFAISNVIPAGIIALVEGGFIAEVPLLGMIILHPAVLLVVIWLADPYRRRPPTEGNPVKLPDRNTYLLVDLGLKWGVALRFVALAVIMLQLAVGMEPPPTNNPLQLIERPLSSVEQAAIVVAIVIIVPIAEEIFYRGLLYQSLGNYLSLPAAAAVSTAVWALLHGSLLLVPPLFALGIFLVVLYESTRSIWVPIAAHMGFNLTSFVLLWLLPNVA